MEVQRRDLEKFADHYEHLLSMWYEKYVAHNRLLKELSYDEFVELVYFSSERTRSIGSGFKGAPRV